MIEIPMDASMREVLRAGRIAAADDGPVLIVGELGTGRESLARFVHDCRPESGPMAVIRCDELGDLSISRTAPSGSVFLAEVGCLDGAGQAKLVGEIEAGIGARVIASATPDAAAPSAAGGLCRDLCRLFGGRILLVPALRDRPAAIPDFIRGFLSSKMRGERAPLKMSDAAMDYLVTYDWPGNIAELEQIADGLRQRVVGDVVTAADLPPQIRWFAGRLPYGVRAEGELGFDPHAEEFQFRLIADALRRTRQG